MKIRTADPDKGWFDLPGVRRGDRSVAEQMLGLESALAECKNKTVVDLGCAEGMIALEFARAGAKSVFAVDYNMRMLESAERELAKAGPLPVQFRQVDIKDGYFKGKTYDIVLALAVLHKLRKPDAGINLCASCARSLIVIRLPKGSTGVITGKAQGSHTADVSAILKHRGFELEKMVPGPRAEMVMHWRRRGDR
jgi:SAM-dependent methyltransferase